MSQGLCLVSAKAAGPVSFDVLPKTTEHVDRHGRGRCHHAAASHLIDTMWISCAELPCRNRNHRNPT